MGAAAPERIGRYQIVCELGQGGMAELHLGRVVGPGGFERLTAIKRIHAHLSKERGFVDMFLDEARTAARLHHPNIVPVFEVGEHEGRHYIAMDYVHGESLALLLTYIWKKRKQTFDLGMAAWMVAGVCDALHAAHEMKSSSGVALGVVHRDVSPQNILIGYDGIPRVTDFGIAKAHDQLSTTAPGSHKGKFAYMAPEQVDQREVDRRADVFAIGIVLWEMIVGKRLFKGQNDFKSAQNVLNKKIAPPSTHRAEVPQGLEQIVMQTLSRDPDGRPATARELGRMLRTWLGTTGQAPGPDDVAALMSNVFPERRTQREQLLHQAGEEEFGAVELTEDSISLSGVVSLTAPSEESAVHTFADPAPGRGLRWVWAAAGLLAIAALAALLTKEPAGSVVIEAQAPTAPPAAAPEPEPKPEPKPEPEPAVATPAPAPTPEPAPPRVAKKKRRRLRTTTPKRKATEKRRMFRADDL